MTSPFPVRRCPCGALANSSGLCPAHKRQRDHGKSQREANISKAEYALGLARTR